MEQARTRSVEAQHLVTLPEVTWADLAEPGAYVERGSGDLYRIPQEALIPGGSPIIHKESAGASRLVQISRNPFVTTLEARLRCAQHNIEPNFWKYRPPPGYSRVPGRSRNQKKSNIHFPTPLDKNCWCLRSSVRETLTDSRLVVQCRR